MKTNITISVNARLMKLVRASGINISQECEDALAERVDFMDSDAIATKIEKLKTELAALGERLIHTRMYDRDVEKLRVHYERRHFDNPKTTREQDLYWLRSVKDSHGMVDLTAEEILEALEK